MAIAGDERLSNPTHGSLLPPSWMTLYELAKVAAQTPGGGSTYFSRPGRKPADGEKFFIAFFGAALYVANVRAFDGRWFLRLAVWIIPLPWLAAEIGWVVAEVGRQPWSVDGVLPTFLGASSLSIPQIWTTIAGFTLIYGALAVIEVRLMLHSINKGPETYKPWHEDGGPKRKSPDTDRYDAVPAE